MMAEDLVNVINLEEPTDIIHPAACKTIGRSLALRYVLLYYLKRPVP